MKIRRLWETNKYYDTARSGSGDYDHPGMILIKQLSRKASKILDAGCGEGSRLNYFAGNRVGYGVDISKKAISLAKRNFPKHKFINSDVNKLPFPDNTFDLVYSAYVLEHTIHPEKFVDEMLRVTSHGGHIVFLAPNYGSPNRCSPCYKGSRLGKLITGFSNDINLLFNIPNKLKWTKVSPVSDFKKYEIDYDTTVEPYANSLLGYLKYNNARVVYTNTLWSQELEGAKSIQKFFRYLSHLNMYPFMYWGPQILIHCIKP